MPKSKDHQAEVLARFLEDIAAHEMTVLRDDGLYRHLRFSRPKTRAYYFDITTWPGYLAYTGDMGSYVFSRIPDMLEFFRYESKAAAPDKLFINPDYWGQKVEAVDRCCDIEEYDADRFRARVLEWLDECEVSPAVRRAARRDVLSRADDGEHEAMRAAMEFECEGFQFQDFYEVSVKEYSHRYLWACYAIAWAVRRWDARGMTGATKAGEGVTCG